MSLQQKFVFLSFCILLIYGNISQLSSEISTIENRLEVFDLDEPLTPNNLKGYLRWRLPNRPAGLEEEYARLIDDLSELPIWPTDKTLEIDTLREVDELLNRGLDWFLEFEEACSTDDLMYSDVDVLFIIALHTSNSRVP